MRRASAPSSPLSSPDYYERLGRLRHGLRDSEKKRLDLEKKLYEYSQSDICRVKLKYVKLKKYLKEICELEKKARTRNQEYLKQFECIQAHIGHFTTNTAKLQELKIEYETQIKKMQLLSEDSLGIKGELKNEDREKIIFLMQTQSHRSPSEKCRKSRRRKVSAAVTLQFLLYNHSDILKEDLEGCGAAVLHQLLRLSPGGGSNEKQVRSEQAPASGLLGARLDQHVAVLKEYDNYIKEEIAKLSEVFPVKNVDQRKKAIALLKRAPTEECEDRSAIHSNESSCSLPSILNDNSRTKEAKPNLWFNRVLTREQEVSRGCRDDSKEESMVAKIPVTGLNIGSGTLKTKTTNRITSEASFSSSEGSPLSSHENKKKLTTNLKSKAFWSESDDSNSEIEAALRPRNHNTSMDDFDDFYD